MKKGTEHDIAFRRVSALIHKNVPGYETVQLNLGGFVLPVRRCIYGMGCCGRFLIGAVPVDLTETLYNKLWFLSFGFGGAEHIEWANHMYEHYARSSAAWLHKAWGKLYDSALNFTAAVAPRYSETTSRMAARILRNEDPRDITVSVKDGDKFAERPLYHVYCLEQANYFEKVAHLVIEASAKGASASNAPCEAIP